jgi:hypothetical protein
MVEMFQILWFSNPKIVLFIIKKFPMVCVWLCRPKYSLAVYVLIVAIYISFMSITTSMSRVTFVAMYTHQADCTVGSVHTIDNQTTIVHVVDHQGSFICYKHCSPTVACATQGDLGMCYYTTDERICMPDARNKDVITIISLICCVLATYAMIRFIRPCCGDCSRDDRGHDRGHDSGHNSGCDICRYCVYASNICHCCCWIVEEILSTDDALESTIEVYTRMVHEQTVYDAFQFCLPREMIRMIEQYADLAVIPRVRYRASSVYDWIRGIGPKASGSRKLAMQYSKASNSGSSNKSIAITPEIKVPDDQNSHANSAHPQDFQNSHANSAHPQDFQHTPESSIQLSILDTTKEIVSDTKDIVSEPKENIVECFIHDLARFHSCYIGCVLE